MSYFNRILVIIMAFVMIGAASVILLVTSGAIDPDQVAFSGWFEEQLEQFVDLNNSDLAWTIGICLLLLLLGVILLFLEIRPVSGRHDRLIIRRDDLGQITIAEKGIKTLVAHESLLIQGVTGVTTRVDEGPEGIVLRCRVRVTPGRSVSEIAQELQDKIEVSVAHHLDQSVASVQIDIDVDAKEARRRVY